MNLLRRELIQEPVLDTWDASEALTVLAAAQNLPDSNPGKAGLVEEAERVRSVVQGRQYSYGLDDSDPEVAEAKEMGLIDNPPTPEDLQPRQYSEEEAHRIEVARKINEYFTAKRRAAALQAEPTVISSRNAPVLSRALRRQAKTDPEGYFGASAKYILETHHLKPGRVAATKVLHFLHLT